MTMKERMRPRYKQKQYKCTVSNVYNTAHLISNYYKSTETQKCPIQKVCTCDLQDYIYLFKYYKGYLCILFV